MSDPYAAALGVADPPAPRSAAPSSADWKAASAQQKFDANSAAIAAQEVAQAKTPADRASALKTQAYTNAKIAEQGGAIPTAANDPYADALGLGANKASAPAQAPAVAADAPKHWWQVTPEQQAQLDQTANDNGGAGAGILQVGAHALTSAAGNLVGLVRAGGAALGGANLNEATQELESTRDALTYTPPKGSAGDTLLQVAGGMKYSPLKLLGDATGYLGNKTLQYTGSPALATVADVGTNAAASMAAGKLLARATAPQGSTISGLTQPPRVEPTMETAPAAPAAPAQVAAPQPNLSLVPREPVAAQAPAAPATAAPASPLSLAPTQPVPGKSAPFPGAAPVAPEITPTETLKSGSALPDGEQAARAKVLQDVGFETSRDAALKGDNRSRAVEYQMSKFQEPAGDAAAQQFAHEAQTMGDYTRGLIKDSGGSLGTDQAALYSRGQAIVRPIQALRNWFDEKASGLYKAADEKAQGQPVTLKGFGDTLNDPSQLTNPDRVTLQGAANAFAKKAGMTVGEDGTLNGTALQAETVRKWLNQERTNANGRYVDALKDSLDNDVGQSAGGPIYDQARALWRLRQQTLGDPKGISSLLDEEGTNRTVPFERVPDNLTKLPQDQFAHIVETLKNLPPELQSVGNTALGEIKSQFLNKMLEGASETRGGNARPFWNGTAVKNVIGDNSGKLQMLMTPEELAKVDTLRKAGDILSFDPSYPGAAAQAQNAVKRGLMSSIAGHATTAAGAGAGALVGFPGAGAVLGRMAGEKVQAATGQKGALNKWERGSVTLRNLMDDPK